VVVVTGARQTGKTTLVRESPPSSAWDYLSFDDPEVRRPGADRDGFREERRRLTRTPRTRAVKRPALPWS